MIRDFAEFRRSLFRQMYGIEFAPCAYKEALPVLYWVTLCIWCFLHSLPLQNALLVFGTFTCKRVVERRHS